LDEVLKGNEIRQTLQLLIDEANLQSMRGRGFRDFRGNDLFFELLVLDDQGSPEEVQRIYSNMIDRRLADLFLGPQTHALSDVAARVAWQRQRTLMTPGRPHDLTQVSCFRVQELGFGSVA